VASRKIEYFFAKASVSAKMITIYKGGIRGVPKTFQNVHVIFAQAFIRLTWGYYFRNKIRPAMWPLVFDNLQIYEMASTEERGVLEGKEGRRGDTERRGRVEVSDQKEYHTCTKQIFNLLKKTLSLCIETSSDPILMTNPTT
jgi:hypothetical protein